VTDINLSTNIAILCGGRGSRLRPLTDQVPKALVNCYGKPILDHIINHFSGYGFNKISFGLGYKGKMIEDHVVENHGSLVAGFSYCGVDASMLQRLYSLKDDIEDRCIVGYGDTFLNLDLVALIQNHITSGALMTLVTAKVQSPLGFVSINDDMKIWAFEEKPVMDYFVGMFIFERQILDMVDEKDRLRPDGEGLVALFKNLAEQEQLNAFAHDGLKVSFNTHDERDNADRELRDFYTIRE